MKRNVFGPRYFLFLVGILAVLIFSLGVPCASAATITVTSNADSGPGSLRQAIASAASGDTITFDNDYTITLASQLDIINKTVTITGAGHHITISGNNAVRVFHVGNPAGSGNLTLDHLNIVNGAHKGNECAGSEASCGGGLMLEYLTTATVSNCTFANNDGGLTGGAIYSYYGNPLTVTNSTFINNHTVAYAGAIELFYGNAILTNNTFIGNVTGGFGSTLLNTWGELMLKNNIIVKGATSVNACDNDFSDGGSTNDGGGNIRFGDATCVGTTVNPLLGTPGDYGGDVPTLPLLPGSPAINAASANCPAVDARGVARGATCASGAFESQGFTLARSGDSQAAIINTAFAAPLLVTVTANNAVDPVDGGIITFTPPVSGATAAITGSPVTIAGGTASVTAIANSVPGGPYSVTAAAAGAVSANFSLTNERPVAALAVSGPAAATGGLPFNATITAKDALGSTVRAYAGTVHFTSGDAGAVLPSDYTFVPGDNGVHTFGVTLKSPGSQTITSTDTSNGSVTGNTTVPVSLLSVTGSEATNAGSLVCTPTSLLYGAGFSCNICPAKGYGLSLFTDNGADRTSSCSANGNCWLYAVAGVTVNHAVDVAYQNFPVIILSGINSHNFSTVQSAFAVVQHNEHIQVQAGTYAEDLNMDHPGVSTWLEGGYDSGFTTASGFTVINGQVVISSGTVTMSKIAIGSPGNAWACTSIHVGQCPVGVLFDGAHIWVADECGEEIYKILASTGEIASVYPGQHGAQYLAYDPMNNNVWVTNPGSDSVTVVNATSGIFANHPAGEAKGSNPDGIVFDGASMWVANYEPATVTQIRASDAAILQTIPVGTKGSSKPRFLAYDDVAKRVWVSIGTDNKVKKIDPETGAVEGDYAVPGFPYAMLFDGTSIWVTQGLLNTVVKLRTSDGAIIGSYDAGVAPNGIAFDGTYIWITDQVGSGVPFPMDTICTVTQLRASDGAHMGTYRTGERPQWVTSGGGYIWITNGSDNTVSRCTY